MSQSKDEGKGKQRFFPSQLQTELCGIQILLVSNRQGSKHDEDRREIRLMLRSETRASASAMMAMIVGREAKNEAVSIIQLQRTIVYAMSVFNLFHCDDMTVQNSFSSYHQFR